MPLPPLQALVHSNGQAAVPGSLVTSQIRLKVPQAADGNSIAPASTTWAPEVWLLRVTLEGMGCRRAYCNTTLRVDPRVEDGKSHHCRESWRTQGPIKLMLRNCPGLR